MNTDIKRDVVRVNILVSRRLEENVGKFDCAVHQLP